MNRNKYFRVVRKTDRSGNTIFEVHGTENRLFVLFNQWTEHTLKNKTLDDAFDHIKSLHMLGLKEKKTVFKGKANKI